MLTKIPIARVKAKPLTEPVPRKNRIAEVIKDELLESLIELQALLKPSSIAKLTVLPDLNSSRRRSKIKMLASTAIPIERMKPAIPARVKVTGIILKSASVIEE